MKYNIFKVVGFFLHYLQTFVLVASNRMNTLVYILLCGLVYVHAEKCYSNKENKLLSELRRTLNNLEDSLKKKSISKCPDGWRDFKSHCYYFSADGDRKPWQEAESQCRIIGGYLAQITDATENTWVGNFINGNGGYTNFWLGGTDFKEGYWRWVNDFSKVQYTHWSPGQPDNKGGKEDCLHIWRNSSNFVWNDRECEIPFRYVCESQPGSSCLPYSKTMKR